MPASQLTQCRNRLMRRLHVTEPSPMLNHLVGPGLSSAGVHHPSLQLNLPVAGQSSSARASKPVADSRLNSHFRSVRSVMHECLFGCSGVTRQWAVSPRARTVECSHTPWPATDKRRVWAPLFQECVGFGRWAREFRNGRARLEEAWPKTLLRDQLPSAKIQDTLPADACSRWWSRQGSHASCCS